LNSHCHQPAAESWAEMDAEQGNWRFVSDSHPCFRSRFWRQAAITSSTQPSRLRPIGSLEGSVHPAYQEASSGPADQLITRLEAIFSGLSGISRQREVGTPRSIAAFLGPPSGQLRADFRQLRLPRPACRCRSPHRGSTNLYKASGRFLPFPARA